MGERNEIRCDQDINDNQKGLENLILLILGVDEKPLTRLHLEKEAFLLWNFHPSIKVYLNFIKHYRGPVSEEIYETIIFPVFLEGCWRYIPPRRIYDLDGGRVIITDKGIKEYQIFINKINDLKDPKLFHLINGIKIVRQIYDQLSVKELLLLIYDTYPEWREKSSIYNSISDERNILAKRMLEDGLIDEERYYSLIEVLE